MSADKVVRCEWARNPLSIAYHDKEWCVPNHDDTVHFEFLLLEGAQAGLSWDTILRKRERYRSVFAGFDPERVARFTPARIERALQDPGIIRNRLKVSGAVQNARAFLKVRDEFGTFDAYVWRFVNGKPVRGGWKTLAQLPATTPVSDALSKDLRKRGFTFVGSTICYSYMQAVGLVNDHVVTCFKYRA
jgi:DNA-3-methyladenine glycosylase I